MKLKKKIPYAVVVLIVIVYLAVLILSGMSTSASIVDDISGLFGSPKIRFTHGRVAEDAEDISIQLESGETVLLNQLSNLISADLSGSTCYDEIIEWMNSHPNVKVKYTVKMPNGIATANDSTVLDLSGLNHESASDVIPLLKYLPNISKIDFGSSSQSTNPIEFEDYQLIVGNLPEAEISYNLSILGSDLPMTSTSVDLSTLSSSDVDLVVKLLKFMTSLQSAKLAENAVSDGKISWEDIAKIANATPNTELQYSFSLLGMDLMLSNTSLDLSSITSASIDEVAQVLPCMSRLETISFGEANLTTDDISKLGENTKASLDYTINIYGKDVNLSDKCWDFNHISISDDGAEAYKWAQCAHSLVALDMDSCGVSNEKMAELRDNLPGVDVIWRVNFGNYSVRTNVTKILASMPSKGGVLQNADVEVLKYCTNLRYLDLGHNDNLTDFSFVSSMPLLEVAVISMCPISSLEPFGNCSNLLYLEAGNCGLTDLSPLAKCTNLKHLNVGTNLEVTDISCLYDLDLKRLWLGVGDPVPTEQVEKMRELHPDCEVNVEVPTGLNDVDEFGNADSEGYTHDWKYWQQRLTADWAYYSANNGVWPAQRPLGYWKVVYKCFEYTKSLNAYAFSWNDPKYEAHGDDVQPINVTIYDTSLLSENWIDEESLVADVLSDPPGEIVSVGEY